MPPGAVPPGGAQPGYPPAVPPPKKSNQTLKIVLIIIAVLAVLCCIGAIIAGAFGYRAFRDVTGPAKDTVTGYFDDLKAGNYDSAYDRLCAETQSTVTREDFVAFQSVLPAVIDYKIVGVNIHNTNGKTYATVDVRVTRERGGEVTQTVQLLKEGGKWKVCEPSA